MLTYAFGEGVGEGSFTLVIWDTLCTKFLSPQAKMTESCQNSQRIFPVNINLPDVIDKFNEQNDICLSMAS